MSAPDTLLKRQDIDGHFSTAEVTHVSKAVQIEGLCCLQNHLRMALTGTEGALREWHDRVTRPNLDRLLAVAREMGAPSPFRAPVEEREDELKARLKGVNVEGALAEGEALLATIHDAEHAMSFYTLSYNLSTNPRAAQAFRDNLEAALEHKPRLLEAYRHTAEFFAPPYARTVEYRGAQAQAPGAKGARGDGRP